MLRTMLKAAAATAAFAVVHSAFASRTAKRAAERALGTRRRNALYRPVYQLQALATFGALALYLRRLPRRTLWHVRGPVAAFMRVGQAAAFAYGLYAARQIGILRMTGLAGLMEWARGEPVRREPAAQGPALGADGRMRATGPFAWSRHPLNLSPLAVFWLFPRMTTRLAAFAAASTVYLVVGSLHEEALLLDAYGPAYERYRRSGVPFYLPRPRGLQAPAGPMMRSTSSTRRGSWTGFSRKSAAPSSNAF